MKELAVALIVLRAATGMKQSHVADLADTTHGLLCAYESGKQGKQAPRLSTLSRLLGVLGFTYADFEEAAAFVERLKGRRSAADASRVVQD